MAVLSVVEYERMGGADGNGAQAPLEPPLAKYDIAIGGASTPGQTLNDKTKVVRLNCDAACRVEIGPHVPVVALATSGRFAPNQTEHRFVPPNSKYAVAVITSS